MSDVDVEVVARWLHETYGGYMGPLEGAAWSDLRRPEQENWRGDAKDLIETVAKEERRESHP